ncbi:MAG: response regulator [Actinobacteria bacterium]|nr:response regulator [Actinomycetota bacterium]
MAKKILVVDDSTSIVNLITVKLAKEGYEVIQAFNGEEALEKAYEERPDLILLDVMMPRLDGKEVCARIKSDPSMAATPIVMLTAVGEFEEQLKGLETGADEYMTKPFDPGQLAAVVRYFLEGGERPLALLEKDKKEKKLRTIIGIMHPKE